MVCLFNRACDIERNFLENWERFSKNKFSDYGDSDGPSIRFSWFFSQISTIFRDFPWLIPSSYLVFLVDTSNFGYRKTSPWYKNLRINTWLSCEWACWTAAGAQNVYFSDKDNLNRFQIAYKPNQFQIFIHQNYLTLTFAAEKKYVLHYEVEFPC